MNRIARRSFAAVLLALVLAGGMVFFCYEYVTQGGEWAVFSGSPHVYSAGNLGAGRVTDRSGTMLLDLTKGRAYADSASVRKATLHWLGDRDGQISAPAPTNYASEMVGFNLIQGLHSAENAPGETMLTISADVQRAALEAMGDRKGTIGVYNYKTGEILCALSTPTYDPDNVPQINGSDAYEGVYLNRFTQVNYTPGSIFKVVTSAAALESIDGIEDMEFTCNGSYIISGNAVTCEKSHGTLTLKMALAQSCNCSFAQVVELLGKDKLTEFVKQFQVTEPLEFDGITTAAGNFDLTDADMGGAAWSGIGQYTDEINACRYMTFMGAIAGDGKAAEPHVVSRVSSASRIRYTAKSGSTGKLLSEETAETLKEYMRNNVETIYGSGNFPGLKVCAKSGTAQVGGDKRPNATFAGFVDDPMYPLAFIVIAEDSGSGSGTCVPILSQVLGACKEVIDNE